MNTISVSYTLVWQFKDYPHLQITRCRKVINTKTGRVLKQCINGGCVGYWVSSNKFFTKNNINAHIQKIKTDINCPF